MTDLNLLINMLSCLYVPCSTCLPKTALPLSMPCIVTPPGLISVNSKCNLQIPSIGAIKAVGVPLPMESLTPSQAMQLQRRLAVMKALLAQHQGVTHTRN